MVRGEQLIYILQRPGDIETAHLGSRSLSSLQDDNFIFMKTQSFETEWGGRTLSIQVGKYANQANGSCVVQYGGTTLLVTATMSDSIRDGLHFFPLMVDYEEKLYAAGRIKGSRFVKREGRPTTEATLTMRYVDRAIRPLFNHDIRNDIQIVITALSFDEENDTDIPALIGASCALHMSDIPWEGPVADIRVGQVDGEWVINPTFEAREESEFDLAFAGTKEEKVIMIEAEGNEVPEDTLIEAFEFGKKHMDKPLALIEEVREAVGKEKTDLLSPETENEKEALKAKESVEEMAKPFIKEQAKKHFFNEPKATKQERKRAIETIKDNLKTHLVEEKGVDPSNVKHGTSIVKDVLEAEVTRMILEQDQRVDGRGIKEIRPLEIDAGMLPEVHGSGHFKRGQTQVMSILTLGSPGDEQTLDGMEVTGKKRFFHHYNFPPYSVGETSPMRGPGRRDIGHGALAEKGVEKVLPAKEDFPYTIRSVSEVLSSNGSSSMASTCGTTLALMDAGVPISKPVAGIAIGMASNEEGDWKVITDIQDLEDGKGGMDFKVTGTRNGVTAIQMDTKTKGLTQEMIKEAFAQGRNAINELVDAMERVIPEPRKELSPDAPRIIGMKIDPEQIGDVIGPGGKVINEIIEETGIESMDIEDDGTVMITSTDGESAKQAQQWVKRLTKKIEKGEVLQGKVVSITDFGAFVELTPGRDGLVHISELAPWHVEKVEDIVKKGQTVTVEVQEVDDKGKIGLTMKDAPGNVYDTQEKTFEGNENTA